MQAPNTKITTGKNHGKASEKAASSAEFIKSLRLEKGNSPEISAHASQLTEAAPLARQLA